MTDFSKSELTRARMMANVMRELGDGCTAEALIRSGFTRREVDKYGETATEIANAAAKLKAA